MTTKLLNDLMDAGIQFSLSDCDKVDAIGRRAEGEHAVLLGILTDCGAVLRTIDPDDGDEAENLSVLLRAINRALTPSRHKGALL